jgi:hypothetical protein
LPARRALQFMLRPCMPIVGDYAGGRNSEVSTMRKHYNWQLSN